MRKWLDFWLPRMIGWTLGAFIYWRVIKPCLDRTFPN